MQAQSPDLMPAKETAHTLLGPLRAIQRKRNHLGDARGAGGQHHQTVEAQGHADRRRAGRIPWPPRDAPARAAKTCRRQDAWRWPPHDAAATRRRPRVHDSRWPTRRRRRTTRTARPAADRPAAPAPAPPATPDSRKGSSAGPRPISAAPTPSRANRASRRGRRSKDFPAAAKDTPWPPPPAPRRRRRADRRRRAAGMPRDRSGSRPGRGPTGPRTPSLVQAMPSA